MQLAQHLQPFEPGQQQVEHDQVALLSERELEAVTPSPAPSTANPSASSPRARKALILASSSTIRTRIGLDPAACQLGPILTRQMTCR